MDIVNKSERCDMSLASYRRRFSRAVSVGIAQHSDDAHADIIFLWEITWTIVTETDT